MHRLRHRHQMNKTIKLLLITIPYQVNTWKNDKSITSNSIEIDMDAEILVFDKHTE